MFLQVCSLHAVVVHDSLNEPFFAAIAVQIILEAVIYSVEFPLEVIVNLAAKFSQLLRNAVCYLGIGFVFDTGEYRCPRIGRINLVLFVRLRINRFSVEN